MKIEELIRVPQDFKKLPDCGFYIRHRNSCGTTIGTWKNENGPIIERRKIDKHGNGWGFFRDYQDIIWFYLIENGFSLSKEQIAIGRSKSSKCCHGV